MAAPGQGPTSTAIDPEAILAKIDVEAVTARFFGDLPIGEDANRFVAALDVRLDEILKPIVVDYLTAAPWDTLEKQVEQAYFAAWGEIRSVDTFARQIEKFGYARKYPALKIGVCRQLNDEMRHFKLYRDFAIRLGMQDILEQPAHPSFELQFDYCDKMSEDPLELVFNCQFCCEKWGVVLFQEAAAKSNLDPRYRAVLDQILPDEHFHVANGRMAARILARQGETSQRRMLEIAARMLAFNRAAIELGNQMLGSF